MCRLTDSDLLCISKKVFNGYSVEDIRVKRGKFADSDNYGIILARSPKGHYVTWQFHLDEHDEPKVYWGHYFDNNREDAVHDFNFRDTDSSKKFAVAIEVSADQSEDDCPFNGDIENDCADCIYSGEYHFHNGECIRRGIEQI